MPPYALAAILSVLGVSAISLIGVITLGWAPDRIRRVSNLLVSFAVGGLLGDAFLHLLPESFSSGRAGPMSACILLGLCTFFLVERLVRHRLYHLHEHRIHPVALMNLVGDGIHNFVDGLLIGASWATGDPVIGMTTTLAVVLHEIPQEIGDFGVLVHGGLTVRRAIWLNALCATTAIAGTLLTLVFGSSPSSRGVLIPFTAGGFLYIAAADLIPELQHEEVDLKTSLVQVLLIGAGIGIMAAFLLIE